jgi:hypothetical protein
VGAVVCRTYSARVFFGVGYLDLLGWARLWRPCEAGLVLRRSFVAALRAGLPRSAGGFWKSGGRAAALYNGLGGVGGCRGSAIRFIGVIIDFYLRECLGLWRR